MGRYCRARPFSRLRGEGISYGLDSISLPRLAAFDPLRACRIAQPVAAVGSQTGRSGVVRSSRICTAWHAAERTVEAVCLSRGTAITEC